MNIGVPTLSVSMAIDGRSSHSIPSLFLFLRKFGSSVQTNLNYISNYVAISEPISFSKADDLLATSFLLKSTKIKHTGKSPNSASYSTAGVSSSTG